MTRRTFLALAVWLSLALTGTLIEGTPDPLPTVALGSTILLHALRAGAVFALGLAVSTVLLRAADGHLPTKLTTTGVAFDAEETSETLAALGELQTQVDRHDALMDRFAAQLDTLSRRI